MKIGPFEEYFGCSLERRRQVRALVMHAKKGRISIS
jgi:hypothetical protein